jgi:hypothetical protein
VNDRRKRWLELLASERRRRIEYREAHCFNLERLEAKLDEMAERTISGGSPWSPTDASTAERLAMVGLWSRVGCAIDAEHEVTALEAWFTTHGYS